MMIRNKGIKAARENEKLWYAEIAEIGEVTKNPEKKVTDQIEVEGVGRLQA